MDRPGTALLRVLRGFLRGVRALPRSNTWRHVVEMPIRSVCAMLPKMPNDEIHLIDMIIRMFTSPVLRVDILRVEKELSVGLLRPMNSKQPF